MLKVLGSSQLQGCASRLSVLSLFASSEALRLLPLAEVQPAKRGSYRKRAAA